MNIFKKLFGQKQTANEDQPSVQEINTPQDQLKNDNDTAPAADEMKKLFKERFRFDNSAENFETELYDSFRRYYSMPDLEFKINLTDTDGVTYKPHEAFNAVFDEWKNIRSKWDRRGILFSFWDESEINKMNKWQVIERYNNDRLPVKAGQYFADNVKNEDLNNALTLVAMAKTNRLLFKLEKARKIIEYAFENLPNHPKVKAEYANILHLHENDADKQLAHKLITEILEQKIASSDQKTIGLLNYFCFSKNYIDSSIFAASFLHAGNADITEWDLLAGEYYYCPVFRYEHAVKLANTNEPLLAMAKLNSLSNEFPWYEKAVSTTVDTIYQFRAEMKNPTFMEEELSQLNHYLSVHNKQM